MVTFKQRKTLLDIAKLNLHGQGIMMKKIPVALLQHIANNNGDNVSDRVRKSMDAIDEKHMLEIIRSWGREGLDGTYLDELTEGFPYVTHATCYIAFKTVGGNNADFRPVGFIVYGTFTAKRNAVGNNNKKVTWEMKIPGVPNNNSVAEIEGVITANAADQELSRNVGRAMFEFAVADIMTRVKDGAPRYKHIITFSSNQRLRDIAKKYGFSNKPYLLHDPKSNQTDVAFTNQLVKQKVVDKPSTMQCFAVDIQEKYDTILNNTKDRIVPLDICGPSYDASYKYWMKCRT